MADSLSEIGQLGFSSPSMTLEHTRTHTHTPTHPPHGMRVQATYAQYDRISAYSLFS